MIDKVLILCGNLHLWDTEARSVRKGMWCRFCHGNTREQGMETFYNRVAQKDGTVLGQYVNSNSHVLVRCKCGREWNALPHNIYCDKWCPTCGHTNYEAIEKFYKIVEDHGGKVIGEYVTTNTHIELICDKGHNFCPKPAAIVQGTWCPTCNGSSGEQFIAKYLSNKGINYLTQRVIEGLSCKRYDFIAVYKGQKLTIEYDGEMHFKFIEYYKYRQIVDRVKTVHAINNGFKVIRIDFSKLR